MSGDERMGEFEEVRRSWATKGEDSPMRCYMGVKGRVTLGELMTHIQEIYPNVAVSDVELNFATAVWEEPPTADDLRKRQEARDKHERRIEEWERETYERLRRKYQ